MILIVFDVFFIEFQSTQMAWNLILNQNVSFS